MGRPLIDELGKRYGRLVVLEKTRDETQVAWRCRCDCGAETVTRGCKLRQGEVISCGCFNRERIAAIGRGHVRHGHCVDGHSSPEYRAWVSMSKRCYGGGHPNYREHGIVVCQRWRDSFEAFLADMGPRPRGHSIDRIDVHGNYEPSNCRWASPSQQQRNKRSNHHLDGVTAMQMRWLVTDYGVTQKAVARAFETNEVTVREVLQGKHWTCSAPITESQMAQRTTP
jgi:hypothetical protein